MNLAPPDGPGDARSNLGDAASTPVGTADELKNGIVGFHGLARARTTSHAQVLKGINRAFQALPKLSSSPARALRALRPTAG